MRAVSFEKELAFIPNYANPKPENHQALLRILYAGICNTDVEITQGYMGFTGILGHEFVAEVIEGSPEWLGKRVVGEINVACGMCDMCHRGVPSQCSNRTTVGIDRHQGAFADFLALTTNNLHIVPDNIPHSSAVFVEPLAAALQILEANQISPRDKVVLIGAGKLGLLVAQVLKLVGVDLSVVVRRQAQSDLLNKWGIRAVHKEEIKPKSCDIVVDCTGVAAGFSDSLDLVRPRGTIILKSTYAGIPNADLTRVVIDEIRIIGSRCGSFESALRLLQAGLIDVESLIMMRYPIEKALEAFSKAQEKGALKVLLEF